jgi:hypothetical protein
MTAVAGVVCKAQASGVRLSKAPVYVDRGVKEYSVSCLSLSQTGNAIGADFLFRAVVELQGVLLYPQVLRR